ncbi:restriction endonuclease subunit S, partial [Megamonas funiformis]|uniref:restriction endonuclease subunit S n=1 Tax=Megamonas funiformis TaxID=437897 RepID=UPI002675A95D
MAKKKQIELTIEEKLQNALVPKEEQPYKIPNNWCWTYFKDIFYIENGYAFKKIDYKKEGIPLVRISNIENGIVNINECIYVNKLEKNEEKYVIEKGDLLIALSGATTGKNGVYYLDEIAYLNQRIGNIKIKNKEKVLNEYRNYYIALKNEDILNLAYGGAQPNISPKVIEFISIPLSPINEQQRIVNRIESLFTKLDRAKELIENTLAQFEQNKMAILHKAFTGELTVKWRKKNNINEKNFFNKVKLKNVIKLISGRDVSVSLCNDKSIGIPYILGASNIKDNKFFIERWIENPVVVSEKNDILLSVKGTIGKLYLQKEEKINISRQIMALRALNDLNTHYLYYFLLRECERLKFEGNGLIPGISRKDILDLNILLPTLEEQQEIVNILDKLLAKYNKIKNLEQQLEKI